LWLLKLITTSETKQNICNLQETFEKTKICTEMVTVIEAKQERKLATKYYSLICKSINLVNRWINNE